MNNNLMIAIAAGAVSFVAAASLGGPTGGFDYDTANEERQQKFLDGVSSGFSAGFKATAGGSANIERIVADAERDLISVDIKFIRPEIDRVSGRALTAFRQTMYAKNCNYLSQKKILDKGVRFKIRMKRPSGATLTNFTFDDESCSSFVKKT